MNVNDDALPSMQACRVVKIPKGALYVDAPQDNRYSKQATSTCPLPQRIGLHSQLFVHCLSGSPPQHSEQNLPL